MEMVDGQGAALTEAERAFALAYLALLDLAGRLNPTNAHHTYQLVLASQALESTARTLREAVEQMWQRDQREVFSTDLIRELRALGAERRIRRIQLGVEE
ncbi:MAG: hypothetical protein ACRDJO_10285 [Actinomycetota bacterium]